MAAGGVMPPSAASAAVGLAPDLRKRVEIMAEHVARNGVDFENTAVKVLSIMRSFYRPTEAHKLEG